MKIQSYDAAASSIAVPGPDRHVLVVESEPDQRRRVVTQLQHWGYVPIAAASGEEAMELIGDRRFGLSLVAIRLPGMSGIEFLRRAEELADTGAVIMIADSGHSGQIVEAIQAGADDFIRRPYTSEDLENAIKTLAGKARPQAAPPTNGGDDAGDRLHRELSLVTSPSMREIMGVIEQAARADVTVLICGETGVGKDLVARAIHTHSPRRRATFVKVNCAA